MVAVAHHRYARPRPQWTAHDVETLSGRNLATASAGCV